MEYMTCPQCALAIVQIRRQNDSKRFSAFPAQPATRPIANEVPDPYRTDYREAVDVLPFSAKASAALSRRSLQALLRDKTAVKNSDLYNEIEEAMELGKLPSHITESLHAVRNIGNFAAHEMKSKATGEIVQVEPGEAEWNLDVLESLFDFYFVEPAKTAKRKAALNARLKTLGKPEVL